MGPSSAGHPGEVGVRHTHADFDTVTYTTTFHCRKREPGKQKLLGTIKARGSFWEEAT